MTIRVGTATQIERNPRDLSGTVPAEAYFMDKPGGPAGTYVFGSGDKAGEATAFLMDDGAGGYVLSDDAADEDLKIYLVTSDTVIF